MACLYWATSIFTTSNHPRILEKNFLVRYSLDLFGNYALIKNYGISDLEVSMKYDQIKELGEEKFRRLTGVKQSTFDKMIGILSEADNKKKVRGGRKNKLSLENRLLMALEYIREYRTYFHVSQSYGVSESTAYDTIRWIENTLIKHPDFALPGRKALLKSDMEYDVILIDATETPIERPKKSKDSIIQAKRKDTP